MLQGVPSGISDPNNKNHIFFLKVYSPPRPDIAAFTPAQQDFPGCCHTFCFYGVGGQIKLQKEAWLPPRRISFTPKKDGPSSICGEAGKSFFKKGAGKDAVPLPAALEAADPPAEIKEMLTNMLRFL